MSSINTKNFWGKINSRKYEDKYKCNFNEDTYTSDSSLIQGTVVTPTTHSIFQPNKSPEGYRPLKFGEKLHKDDLCYSYFDEIMGSLQPWNKITNENIGKEFNSNWPATYRKIKSLEITQDMINKILFKLKSERAFNGDSALEMQGNDLEICEHLEEKGEIKGINNRYYLKERFPYNEKTVSNYSRNYFNMKLNKKIQSIPAFTEEGAKINQIGAYQSLRRSVLATLLWEDNCYEDGISVANRIAELVTKVNPEKVSELAIEARTKFKLRHVPLLLARELARNKNSRYIVADTLAEIIQRPDELSEYLAIYWAQGKCPLASQVKRGLARAFTKFDEYSLAKHNKDNAIKLRDVLFLCHGKPINKTQEKLWKKLINNELKTPDTWEVELSNQKGENKKDSWERLLKQDKLGALALLRNLRNFKENSVNEKLIINALENMQIERVLPFRFIAAARYYPSLEPQLEKAMFKCLEKTKLSGKTALIIDTSPSMWMHKISSKSDMDRFETASALAILLREICQDVRVYAFNKRAYEVPNRRGFALRDALAQTKDEFSCGSLAIDEANKDGYDRIICLTDGQWHAVDSNNKPIRDNLGEPINYTPLKGSYAYMLNVANNKNGVGYGKNWINLDGFSENIINYIIELENLSE